MGVVRNCTYTYAINMTRVKRDIIWSLVNELHDYTVHADLDT